MTWLPTKVSLQIKKIQVLNYCNYYLQKRILFPVRGTIVNFLYTDKLVSCEFNPPSNITCNKLKTVFSLDIFTKKIEFRSFISI